MGNVRAHRTIADAVMDLLDRARPNENHMFFALGNSLTDLSQVCDPPAHAGGKIKAYQEGRKAWFGTHTILKGLAHLDGYLNELLGELGMNGKLAHVLLYAVYAMDLEKFRGENPSISPENFDRIFWSSKEQGDWYRGFTQYWPHEHLDFPPWPYGDVIGERSQSPIDVHRCYAPAGTVDGSPDETKAKGGNCWFELHVVAIRQSGRCYLVRTPTGFGKEAETQGNWINAMDKEDRCVIVGSSIGACAVRRRPTQSERS